MSEQDLREFFQVGDAAAATLENDLKHLLQSFSGDKAKAAELSNLLIARYSEKHRAYHNLSHIKYLLDDADAFKVVFHDYESVRLAIWFHDAIYEPKSRLNEIDSAQLAVRSLTELNFPKASVEKIEKMILATQKHDASFLDEDGEMFLDFDLAILGTTPEIYKKYSKAIRAEYSFVPEDLYRRERRKILQSFSEREFIYYTADLREFYEEAARINIANEIKELS
jgi:predicted metal-dependent HD superfamily phosphohydrolase